MLLLAGGGLLAALVLLAALALSGQPDVPPQLPGWPSLGFLYLQLLRAAVKRKAPPSGLTGKPIQVQLSAPVRFDLARYAAFLKLVGFKQQPAAVPLSYPFVEAFRLSMLAMSHPDFPFAVLGAVLARNTSTLTRALAVDEQLIFTTRVDPNYVKNEKGDFEIAISTTAMDGDRKEVWVNSLTVIVINPKRQRGGGAKPAAGAASGALQRTVLGQLLVPANAGRAFGGLTADRNPIHLCSATSQLFGFRQPIAHAMYLVARLEASLAEKGYVSYAGARASYPLTLATEFKRPTPLPAKLQAVVEGGATPGRLPLQCGVLSSGGDKDVIVGRLS